MRSGRVLSFLTVCAVAVSSLSFNAFAQDEQTANDVIFVEEPVYLEDMLSEEASAAEVTRSVSSDDVTGVPTVFTEDYISNFGVIGDMVEVPVNEKFNTLDGVIDSALIDIDDRGISVAKVFTPEEDCILDQVRVYIPDDFTSNGNYIIAVFTNGAAGDPDSGSSRQWLYPNMSELTPGAYNYIDLDDILLTAGESCSIIVAADSYWGDKLASQAMPVTYGSLGEGTSYVRSGMFYYNYKTPWTDLHELNYSVPVEPLTVPVPDNFLGRPNLYLTDLEYNDAYIMTGCYNKDFELGWGKVAGATGYKVYRWCADGTQKDYTLLADVTTTKYKDTTVVK